ncbi:MAG: DUF1549 domain-containing protein, partial [Nitrososphaera sp.]
MLQTAPRNNFIDEYIFGKMERDGIPYAGLCTDEEFIRRVYLDLTGRIPAAEIVRSFVSDSNPAKRDMLVDTLIGTPPYVDRWTIWLSDFFRNTIYPGSAEGRNAFYFQIRRWVQDNTPYNQIAQELITAAGDSFSNGPLNYLMKAGIAGDYEQNDTLDDMAVAVTRNFLGVKILCIS